MAIVYSEYLTDAHQQAGGGFLTVESFTDSTGATYTNTYLWDGVTDRSVILSDRSAALASRLADEEAAGLLG